MPVPIDTRASMIDICRKFGSDIYLGGEIESIDDINNIRQTLFLNPNYSEECANYGRFTTWLPYTLQANLEIRHDITNKVLDFDQFKSIFNRDNAYHFEKEETAVVGFFGEMMSPYKRLTFWTPTRSTCAMCLIPSSHEKTTVVNLRGVCKFSKFDLKYQVSMLSDGSLIYYGHIRSVITYNYSLSSWQIMDTQDIAFRQLLGQILVHWQWEQTHGPFRMIKNVSMGRFPCFLP